METLTAHTSICRQTVIEGDRVFAQSVWTPTNSSDLRVGGTLGVAAVDPTFAGVEGGPNALGKHSVTLNHCLSTN